MKSEAVAAESPGGGLSVKAARDVLIKNNGHVGVLTESIVPSSDIKNEDSGQDSKDRHAGDSNEKGKSEAGGSDMHARSSSSQNARASVFDVAAASSSYMDDSVTKNHDPHSLYGSFTWKVPNFKDVSKRELKSSSFSVGPYKWYILVYPNGCDVSNHLSLFLCVADYDKLLPGWSHFAQFTIAVVNKDPKKSKYSDTLHRFCKKEHDWGWKKFMELGKMQDGFVVSDTLVIKVQVQVIKDRQIAPFRTLDSHYRKELIRVYLSNIEGIVRRSVEKTKDLVAQLLERGVEDFWSELSTKEKEKLSSTPTGPLLKSFTKVFFNEKEVTSTLMMDAAYCAMKVLDVRQKRRFEGLAWTQSDEDTPGTLAFREYIDSLNSNIYLCESKSAFVFKEDALEMLASFVLDPLSVYPFTETVEGSKAESNEKESLESSSDMKVSAERDELKLIDLARLTMEVFAMAQIAEQNIDNAWKEAEIIRRQEELIREEEEAHKDEAVRLAAKAEAERERKARKKERQRAKKEAERMKQEALEAEKAREEELKKVEQEKKRQEAEERKRQEEAKKEAERQRQLELKQAALTAKKLAKSKNRSLDDSEKTIPSIQDDTDSLEDSSGITSARSDQSSKCASKTSKAGTMTQQTTVGGEDSSRSSGSTQDNIVAEMRMLLQKREDEIVSLKERIKSLEEDLENALARMNVNSSPSTPPQNNAGLQPLDESSVQSTSSPILPQAGVTSHAYIMQQMAKTSNPQDAILAGAVSHRVSQVTNGMKSSGSHKDIANMMNAPRSSGVNYRVGTQNQAGRSQIHPTQTRQQQMGQRGAQYIAGYNNGNTMMNTTKVVGYGQFSQQGTAAGPQVTRPVMTSSQNRLSPKMNNTRGYQANNDIVQNNMNQSGGTSQQGNARHMGESSGLDDFAHLGLITDLLE